MAEEIYSFLVRSLECILALNEFFLVCSRAMESGTFVCSIFILLMCGHTGRFDDSVIEERRQCSEDLLQFSANIPALYGSQHIQEFFKVSG